MSEKTEQWTTCVGGYDWSSPCDSREQAIMEAIEDNGLVPGDTLTIARAFPSAGPDLASLFLGALESHICDEAPEDCGHEYLATARAAEDDLRTVLDAWAERHRLVPDWFECHGEETVIVPADTDEEDLAATRGA